MTTRVLRVRADISGALTSLQRLQNQGRRTARQLNHIGGGAPGAAIGGARRVGGLGGGLGRAALAGAGIGAGAAIIERLLESLFELFEGTDTLELFAGALKELLAAASPIAGVLIRALVQPLRQLLPTVGPLVQALAPLIELLGGALTAVITLLAPLIIQLAGGLEGLLTRIRDFVLGALPGIVEFVESATRYIVRWLNRLPGVNIELPDNFLELPDIARDTLDEVRADLTANRAAREQDKAARESEGIDSPYRAIALGLARDRAERDAGRINRELAQGGDLGSRSLHVVAATADAPRERTERMATAAAAPAPRERTERMATAAATPAPRERTAAIAPAQLHATIIVEVDGQSLEPVIRRVQLDQREAGHG